MRKKFNGSLFYFISLHSFFCVFVYSFKSVSFHLLKICLSFLPLHFFEFSCWLSSTNNLTWIFVAFVTFIEVVSLWFVLVIMIGILGLIAAKRPFPLLFKKRIKPLTPRSDQHETSRCNSLTLYRKQRMRICKLIR